MLLTPGDPIPWFSLPSLDNPRYAIHAVAGRYVLLAFFSSATRAETTAALAAVRAQRALFDDVFASFFGITIDPGDREFARLQPEPPGIRFLFDLDGGVCRQLGFLRPVLSQPGMAVFHSSWVLLDPMLRVMETRPLAEAAAMMEHLAALPPPEAHGGCELPPPILIIPRVFEPTFCRALIAHYEAQGGQPSGFMREEGGRTVGMFDPKVKRRRDCTIEDEALKAGARQRILKRVVPEIRKVHHFAATRMERYIVACYDAAEGGHFAPHRDNTTSGTAHRRFAVSINLNAEDFAGGELRFPEYGPRRWKAPTGAAVVFSCSLLHEVLPVTAGKRYAFLPFLYDEAAATVRQRNRALVVEATPPAAQAASS